jgi:hypothetical protein
MTTKFFLAVCSVAALSMAPFHTVHAQQCAVGSRYNPYGDSCADVRVKDLGPDAVQAAGMDVPSLDSLRSSSQSQRRAKVDTSEPPVPGGYGGGIRYRSGELRGLAHSELHTRLFVHPDGINPSSYLEWLFTPATNRMSSPVELVGIYNTRMGDRGSLGLFARSCSVEYPCPNGEVESGGWQWFQDFNDIPCNVTDITDQGGHSQKVIQYANRTERLDNGAPPLWKNEVLLWNFCDNAWDQVYYHEYREYKQDCSTTGCAWWGPILETFGDVQPEIDELGAEDTRLYLDGSWHYLGPGETQFRNPVAPWSLFHLTSNNSFGAGNRVEEAAVRIEAEDMTLDTYRRERKDFASAGEVINLKGPGEIGSATSNFGGEPGRYDVYVAFHDENDGPALLTVSIAGDTVDSWVLDRKVPGGEQAEDFNRFRRLVATNKVVLGGDEIRIEGVQGNWDHANVDYIEFVMVAPPEPIRIEAEDMQLVTYRPETQGFASGGQLINLKGPGASGSATAAFEGKSGQYTVDVVYHDENDGQAELAVSIAGVTVDTWILEEKIAGGEQAEDFNRFTRRVAGSLTVNKGDEIRIDGLQGNWDHASVDYIEFTESFGGEETIRIRALIDGRSRLTIQGNSVQWQHFNFAAPGRHSGVNEPTIVNGYQWLPVWPDVPNEENRECNCFSDRLELNQPLLPKAQVPVSLDPIAARGIVEIVEQPSAANNYALVVEFNDNDIGASADYEILLSFAR